MPDAHQYNASLGETQETSQAKDLGRKNNLSQKISSHSFKLALTRSHSKARRKVAFTLAEVFFTHSAGKRKIAFTLAEVLITLGIIGVVAALTLPTLMANFRKSETITRLRKFDSVMQQAILMAQNDFGDPNGWEKGDNVILKDEQGENILDEAGNAQYDTVKGSKDVYEFVMPLILSTQKLNLTMK